MKSTTRESVTIVYSSHIHLLLAPCTSNREFILPEVTTMDTSGSLDVQNLIGCIAVPWLIIIEAEN